MYYYIYDTFLNDKKYERILASVETRLTDLGISGKIGRLTPFTNAKGLIRDEVKRGAHTIVAVGNDETIAKIVDGIGEAKITMGIIPVGPSCRIARSLGIPEGEDSCEVLSRRITQKIDLGTVNGHFFLSHVRMPGAKLQIEGDGMYRITSLVEDCELTVSNLRVDASPAEVDEKKRSHDLMGTGYLAGDPMDGWLDAFITPRASTFFDRVLRRRDDAPSVIPMRRVTITCPEPIAIEADGRMFSHNVISIEIVPDHLKIITGRERVFA